MLMYFVVFFLLKISFAMILMPIIDQFLIFYVINQEKGKKTKAKEGLR